MNTYLSILGGAFLLLAIIGWLISLVIREARDAQAERDANTFRNQEHDRQQANIMVEHRDPDDAADRLRNGSF